MRKALSLCVSLMVVLSAPVPLWAAPINDSIVAVVNDDVITLKDLKDYISSIYRQLKVEHHSESEIRDIMTTYEEKGINQLIEDKLILAAANEKGMEIRPEMVDKRLNEIRDKYPDEDKFLTALNAQGVTVTDLKNKLTNQMKARYIVDMEVRDKVFVNPQDVTNYYNKHATEFTRRTKYNLQSVYISFDKGKQSARNRAAEARAKLAAGEDFDKVNKEYSEAPSVGTIEQGEMVPAVEKEVFSLGVDQVSQPIEVEGGIYVFKVIGILPGRVDSLQEARDEIYAKLFDGQFQEKFRAWIEKLRKKNYVEIRD